jgi:hypothetical protein
MIIPEILENYSNPAFLEAYREWQKHPVTVRMLHLAKVSSRPSGLSSLTGEAALYYGGAVDANEAMLTFLLDFESLCKRHLECIAASSVRLESTYGVKKLDKKDERKS